MRVGYKGRQSHRCWQQNSWPRGPFRSKNSGGVADKTVKIGAVSSLPVVATGLALGAPGAIGAIERGGRILSASRYGPALIKAGEFVEGAFNPNPSLAGPTASKVGTLVKTAYDEFKNAKSFLKDLTDRFKIFQKDREEMQPDPHTKQSRRWR